MDYIFHVINLLIVPITVWFRYPSINRYFHHDLWPFPSISQKVCTLLLALIVRDCMPVSKCWSHYWGHFLCQIALLQVIVIHASIVHWFMSKQPSMSYLHVTLVNLLLPVLLCTKELIHPDVEQFIRIHVD